MSRKIEIDGCSIYVEKLQQYDPDQYIDDAGGIANSVLNWTADQITEAMRPAVNILNSLRNATQEIVPDEMELAMQFEVGLNGKMPVFKIVSTQATAQIAVKFVWKQEHR